MTAAAGEGERRRYWQAAVLAACAVTVYRLVALHGSSYGLQGDEAQYWTWAQAPAFGYYSKPPMVAWLIALSTALCGDTPFCVRLTSPFIHAATSLVVFLIAERLYGVRAGFWAALSYLLLPGVSFYAVAATTDTPLLFFWALGLYAFLRATREDAWRWWLLAGAALGFGLLSKYNMAVFALSAFLYLLASPVQRRRLLRPRPYAALVLGLLIYLPNLAWNIANGFVSYRHTRDISHAAGNWLNAAGLFEFLAAQFAVFGPLFFAVLLFLLFRAPRLVRTDDRCLLLFCFIMPWFAVVSVVALLSRAHANWGIPVYVAGTVLVVGWLVERGRVAWVRVSLVVHLAIAALFYHYDAVTRVFGIELTARTDPFKALRGWDEAGREVAAALAAHPGAALLTDHRMTTALLMYYARPDAVVEWNPDGAVRDHYELTTGMQGREGQDFVLVTAGGEAAARNIGRHFRDVESLPGIRVPVHRDFTLAFDVYLLKDFRGYGVTE